MLSAPLARNDPVFTIGICDDAILTALGELHVLTAPQLCRLLYSPGSLTYVRAKLAALVRAGYLETDFLKRASRGGSAPLVYWLTGKGGRYLRSTSRDIRPRLRRSDMREYGYLHQAHSLAVSEVLLQARLLARKVREVQLARLIHERDMKRFAVKVEASGGRKVQVIPDGFVEFIVGSGGKRTSCPIVFELDRGSHGVSSWSKKAEALAVWTNKGAYQKALGASFLTIAVVVTNDTWNTEQLVRRQQVLQAWTENVLTALGEEKLSELFLFGCLPRASTDPERFFLEPAFLPAFGKEAVPLVERTVSAA